MTYLGFHKWPLAFQSSKRTPRPAACDDTRVSQGAGPGVVVAFERCKCVMVLHFMLRFGSTVGMQGAVQIHLALETFTVWLGNVLSPAQENSVSLEGVVQPFQLRWIYFV